VVEVAHQEGFTAMVETHVNKRKYLPKNMSQIKFEILTLNEPQHNGLVLSVGKFKSVQQSGGALV
jgi:hypothetical protein